MARHRRKNQTQTKDKPQHHRRRNRILWNKRPEGPNGGGDIDEIVIHNCTVHIEQMDDNYWWIGIDLDDGTQWMGNFLHDKDGQMVFMEQESDVEWDKEDSHDKA